MLMTLGVKNKGGITTSLPVRADEEGGGLRGKRADRFWRQPLEAGTQRGAQRWNPGVGQLLVGEVTEQLMEDDGRGPPPEAFRGGDERRQVGVRWWARPEGPCRAI